MRFCPEKKPVHTRDDEVIIPTDIFDVIEFLGHRCLFLTKPFLTNKEHADYLNINKLFVYDLYYIDTEFEQADRIRIIKAQDKASENYYGTILTRCHIPGAGSDTADDGSIHVDIAEIKKAYIDNQSVSIRTTVQGFIDFYNGIFLIPNFSSLISILYEHGRNDPNTVYYGADGIKDTKSTVKSAVNTMCRIFDEFKKVNPDIDPKSRPPLTE